MFDTPLLILGFNRPDLFSELLISLRELSPANIYIAIDGPRKGNEDDRVSVNRTISSIGLIDWPCDLRTLIRKSNVGCGRAVSSAISWVFTTESKVIVLEDDIRPNKSFFEFCAHALVHFAEDERIMTIGGHSLIDLPNQSTVSRLSRHPEIWGWATWRRSWELYNFSIEDLPRLSFGKLLSLYGGNFILTLQNLFIFRKMRSHSIDTWDYQLQYCSFLYEKMHLISNVNLTENVGFNSHATHTKYLPVPSPQTRELALIDFQAEIRCSKKLEKLTRKQLQAQLATSIKSYVVAFCRNLKSNSV